MEKRKALSSDEALLLSENVFENFIHYFKPVLGQKVHIFLPIEKFNEINTDLFLDYFFKNHIKVFVPKIVDTRLISVEFVANSKLEINKWGILEPISEVDAGIIDFDFIITPLLYCDDKGNRVGYGKGFYDGFFESVSNEAKKIGVNYFNPDENIDDVWENDIPLDYLVTPSDILSFFGSE